MFLQNERGLGVKNGTLGAIEQVSAQSMTVRTDDGCNVSFDLKDYNKIDHGYAATIHKAQGMTVDHAHVLATPGMDAHGSYVALSRHRDRMDLHYGRDDFASQDKLINVLSRDRAKDMASDYEPARDYAERRGITFRERVERVVEIVRQVPEKVRGLFDGLRPPAEGGQGPERKLEEDPEATLRRARGRALVRHARAVDAIFAAQNLGGQASPDQIRELQEARQRFEEVRPHGPHDAEAAYKKNPELAAEAASGDARRGIRALQLETELRTDPSLRADRFVERWRELGQTSQRQYRRATCPVTSPRGQPWATWQRALNAIPSLNPSLRVASATSALGSTRAVALAGNSPSATVSTSVEAGVSDCRTILFSAASTPQYYDA